MFRSIATLAVSAATLATMPAADARQLEPADRDVNRARVVYVETFADESGPIRGKFYWELNNGATYMTRYARCYRENRPKLCRVAQRIAREGI